MRNDEKKVVVCDICGNEFPTYKNGQAKVKIRKEDYPSFDDWEFNKWIRLDLCPECMSSIISEILKRSEQPNRKE